MTTSRAILNPNSDYGVVIRLNPALNEQLEVVVQDDLTVAGIDKFRVIAQGSEVQQ